MKIKYSRFLLVVIMMFCPRLFLDAWIKPEIVRKWLFVGETSQIISIALNVEIDGSFSIMELENINGARIDHFGKYIEIEPPYRLAFTLNVPGHFPGETTVAVHIFPTLNGCELKLTQTGVPKDVTEKNWIDMLHKLKTLVEEL